MSAGGNKALRFNTDHADFEADLKRHLEKAGALRPEVEGYLSAMRRSGILVLATASGETTHRAVQVMSRRGTLDVDEVNRAETYAAGVRENLAQVPHLAISVPGRTRCSGSGARLFLW